MTNSKAINTIAEICELPANQIQFILDELKIFYIDLCDKKYLNKNDYQKSKKEVPVCIDTVIKSVNYDKSHNKANSDLYTRIINDLNQYRDIKYFEQHYSKYDPEIITDKNKYFLNYLVTKFAQILVDQSLTLYLDDTFKNKNDITGNLPKILYTILPSIDYLDKKLKVDHSLIEKLINHFRYVQKKIKIKIKNKK